MHPDASPVHSPTQVSMMAPKITNLYGGESVCDDDGGAFLGEQQFIEGLLDQSLASRVQGTRGCSKIAEHSINNRRVVTTEEELHKAEQRKCY